MARYKPPRPTNESPFARLSRLTQVKLAKPWNRRLTYHQTYMKRFLALFAVASMALAGCGGGGGNPNIFGPQKIDTYVTDSFRDDYDHVWVTIYRAVLNGPTPATLFDDPNGRVIDLKTLRDASGQRYAFLETAQVESAIYSELAVTVGKDLVIVPTGASAGQNKEFSDLFNDAGKTTLRYSMLGFSINAGAALPIDFDLAAWTIEGSGRVRASIKLGTGNGVSSQTRHEPISVRGTVSTLTGTSPDFTFMLARPGKSDLKIVVNNKTRIYNESGAQSPALSTTSGVEVTGIGIGGTIVASSLKLEDLGGNNAAELTGDCTTANEGAGTFALTVNRAEGFMPTRTSYTVATSGATKFLSDTGATITMAEFYAQVESAAAVTVEGTSSGGIFDAVSVRLDSDASLNEVQVSGSILTIAGSAFTLSTTQWSGVSLRIGDTLLADVGGSTVYTLNGATVNQATFFASVGAGDVVRVSGLLNGTTITALRVSN